MLSTILASLPNGFHDARLLKFSLDCSKKELIFDLDIWIDEKLNSKGDFDCLYRKGTLTVSSLNRLQVTQDCFSSFNNLVTGAWVDLGYDFSNISAATGFSPGDNSAWLFFHEYNGFIFFDGDMVRFKWL